MLSSKVRLDNIHQHQSCWGSGLTKRLLAKPSNIHYSVLAPGELRIEYLKVEHDLVVLIKVDQDFVILIKVEQDFVLLIKVHLYILHIHGLVVLIKVDQDFVILIKVDQDFVILIKVHLYILHIHSPATSHISIIDSNNIPFGCLPMTV